MNNSKLKSLTHKLVELKNSTDHMKGFLFRDISGNYFIKPIEVYKGTAKEAGKFYLTEEHVEFTNFCESPKLMKVSMKSWHYRLMKYVLRSNVPTPQTMQNGCPYFWLLVFSLLVVPFLFVLRGFWSFCLGFPYLFWKVLELVADITLRFMPEESAYHIEESSYYDGWHRTYYTNVPILAKAHLSHTGNPFLSTFIKVRYHIDKEKDPEAYAQKMAELKQLSEQWAKKREADNRANEERRSIEMARRNKLYFEREAKRKARQERNRLFWKPFNDRMSKIGNRISSAMTFDYKKSPIIKRTKQFIGLLVSLFVLCITIFLVMSFTFLFISIADGIAYLFVHCWKEILAIILILAAVAIVGAICYLALNWIQSVISKYRIGKKVWYVQGFLYVFGYPVKYIILGIYYLIYSVVYIPLKFIFYTILWKIILVNLCIFLWGLMRAIGGIFVGSLGIFGEYFGASKKDYCPGIEWTDVDE